ncbi:MAG TPA: hypothetical protein VGB56_02220 [Flavisolibacter sp.]
MKKLLLNQKLYWLGIIVLTMISACGSSRRSIAIEEGWELLGESKVNFVRDKDQIKVYSSNSFTAIRFRVEDRDVVIHDLSIFFTNGDKLEPNIDEVVVADQYSRVIELAREGRNIDRIEFRYRTTGNVLRGRAKVLILGQRYDPYRRF